MSNFDLQKEKWEKRRLKGKKRHIIQFFLISEMCALVFATLNVLINKTNTLSDNIIGYCLFIIIWGVLGIWIANSTWKRSSEYFDR